MTAVVITALIAASPYATWAHLADQLGVLTPNTPDETHLALLAALRCARDADEAAAFKAMLFGAGGAA